MAARSFSIAAASPKPLMTTLAPAPAILRAMARPMPLVEPVTTAVLPLRSAMWSSFLDLCGIFAGLAGQVVDDHRLAGLWFLEAFGVLHGDAHVFSTGAPVLQHADSGKVVVL